MLNVRRQQIQQPKNGLPGTCRYADLSKPLPDPPKGQTWVQDESSREWKLIPVAPVTANDDVAVAVVHPPNTNADGAVVAGVDNVGIQYHQVQYCPPIPFRVFAFDTKSRPRNYEEQTKLRWGRT